MPSNASRRRSRRGRYRPFFIAFCCLLWLTAGFLIAEFAIRAFLPTLIAMGETEKQENARRNSAYNSDWQVTKDGGGTLWKIPGWEYHPNSRIEIPGLYEDLSISINQHGFRGPDFEIPKPPGVFRIVCVGGSTTLDGMRDESTYPYLLERKLQAMLNTDRVEVINAGISGFTTQHELLKMPRYLALEPDLILEYSGVNDVFLVLRQRDHESMPWWWRLAQHSVLVQVAGSSWFEDEPPQLNEPGIEEMRVRLAASSMSNLSEMNARTRARDIMLVCMTFGRPSREQLSAEDADRYDWNLRMHWRMNGTFKSYCDYIDVYNEELSRLCDQQDIPLIPLQSQLTGGFEIYSDICHCTARGTEQKAQVIAEYLKDLIAPKLAQGSGSSG